MADIAPKSPGRPSKVIFPTEVEIDSTTPPSTSTVAPHSRKDKNEGGFFRWCQAWYFFALHPIMTLIIVTTCLKLVDKQEFVVYRSGLKNVLTQPDIVRLIGYGLRVQGIVATVCQGIVAQRIVFQLMETSGLCLGELSRVYDMKLPIIGRDPRVILLGAALLLTWPAQLSSPLFTGSIT